MAGWHHQLDGYEFEWTPGVGDGQGGLVCCNSWGRRVGHDWVTELTDWWLSRLKKEKKKKSACNSGDPSLIPGSEISLGEVNGTHSSVLAWRTPWIEESGGLQSMGSQRVRHSWATNTHTYFKKKKKHFPHTALNAQERLENQAVTFHILGKCGK